MMVENIVTDCHYFPSVGAFAARRAGAPRLGDVYQRMHGAGIIDTGGAGPYCSGCCWLHPTDSECALFSSACCWG